MPLASNVDSVRANRATASFWVEPAEIGEREAHAVDPLPPRGRPRPSQAAHERGRDEQEQEPPPLRHEIGETQEETRR